MSVVLGITGGIASGKTTVTQMFHDLGAEVLSADDVAREVLAPGSPASEEAVERFGTSILRSDGSIDREVLGGIVFHDREARETLEKITHPRITDILEDRIRRFREEPGMPSRSPRRHEVLAVEIPLLVECNLARLVDEVVVVAAEQDAQINRLKERGLSPEQSRERVAAQASADEKLAVADWVVRTDVSLDDTRRQVEQIWERITC